MLLLIFVNFICTSDVNRTECETGDRIWNLDMSTFMMKKVKKEMLKPLLVKLLVRQEHVFPKHHWPQVLF